MTQQPDRIRQYLRRRGCTPRVVKGGLEGLLSHWESVVTTVGDGYDLTLPDYQTDMELRDVLQGAIEYVSSTERAVVERKLDKLDRKFRELTVDCGPVSGEELISENGYDATTHWWFFRRPRRPAPDFEEELREAGLV